MSKRKYSLKKLLNEEMEQMSIDFGEESEASYIDLEGVDPSDEENIRGDLDPEDFATEPDLEDVADEFEQLFGFMAESTEKKSKKKYSLLESTAFPRELSGGAGAIMVMMANFNIGKWTNVDTAIFAGQPILSYAQASGAQINALNTFFGARISKGGSKPRLTTYIASGAAKPSSGIGADLEMNDSSGTRQMFEVKSDINAKGSTKRYSLLKEFTAATVKEFNKTPGLKKLGLKASLTPNEISAKIDSMSNSDFTKFKKALVTKMAGEALLVPNYTTGIIYGASNADVAAALLGCSKAELRGKRGYSDTRNGIKFPVDCTIKAKSSSMPSHVLTSFNEMLKQARKAGYNVASMIKKDYPKESDYDKAIKKWNDARKAMDPPKKPNKFVSYSAACNQNAKSNKTNDIRAFLTAKGKKTFLSYGTYKLLTLKGGGQSAEGWRLVMAAISQGGAPTANPNPGTGSGDGTSKPPKKPSGSSGGGFDFDKVGGTYRDKVRNKDAIVPSNIKILVQALVDKEITLDVFSGTQRPIFEKAMKVAMDAAKAKTGASRSTTKKDGTVSDKEIFDALKSEYAKGGTIVVSIKSVADDLKVTQSAVRKVYDNDRAGIKSGKASRSTRTSTKTGRSSTTPKYDVPGKTYSKRTLKKIGRKYSKVIDQWSKDTKRNKSEFKKLAGKPDRYDYADFVKANENLDKYNLMARLMENVGEFAAETETEYNELLNDPTMEINPEIEDIFYMELARELELAGVEIPAI